MAIPQLGGGTWILKAPHSPSWLPPEAPALNHPGDRGSYEDYTIIRPGYMGKVDATLDDQPPVCHMRVSRNFRGPMFGSLLGDLNIICPYRVALILGDSHICRGVWNPVAVQEHTPRVEGLRPAMLTPQEVIEAQKTT